ncbi:glycosyltransferase family 2 protein [Citrobacter braakii]
MKVSIITATYNSSEYIRDTYNSICKQSHSNWEWLVTDDCSSDATISILEDISQKDERVIVFKNEVNSGAAVSRNNSLDHVSGDIVAFIDSDDLWLENKLSEHLHFYQSMNSKLSFTGYTIVDNNGVDLGVTVDTSHKKSSFSYTDFLMKKGTFGCSTALLSAGLASKYRMPNIRTGQDYAYWILILREEKISANIFPLALTQYRKSTNSISKNKFKKAKRQWEIYNDIENIKFPLNVYYFFNYAMRTIIRKK